MIAALALAMAILSVAGDPQTAATEIRALRAASNAAIARHDLAGMKAVVAPEYVVLPGSVGTPSDLSQFDARIGATFADPQFVTYVRTAQTVTIADDGARAAETGTWVGRWRKPDGEMRLSGVYQAMWVPTVAGWRLRNESFVTLACKGSVDCPTKP